MDFIFYSFNYKKGGITMRLNAPAKTMFWLSVILAIIAVILFIIGGFLLDILVIIAFGILAIAFILLALSVLLEKW